MYLLMLLFAALYFSDPSGSNLFFLSSLVLSHRSRISAVIQFFFSSDACLNSPSGHQLMCQSLVIREERNELFPNPQFLRRTSGDVSESSYPWGEEQACPPLPLAVPAGRGLA